MDALPWLLSLDGVWLELVIRSLGSCRLVLSLAGLIEFHDEIFHSRRGTHYLKGGTPGKNMVPGLYDPLGFARSRSEEDLARGRAIEIKNGRLAMIGFMGLYAAAS